MNIQNQTDLTMRELLSVYTGVPASDGDGVKLTRIIGSAELNMLDPFLLLDAFESDESQDYIGGFPKHPHRGFETVTYLLAGRMRHKDSAGHEGIIEPGGVQWMTAGKGIFHSEMPEQQEGLLKGFQLWVNLPKAAKMTEPAYQEYDAANVAVEKSSNGTQVRVIVGTTDNGTRGPVHNDYVKPTYMDITLPQGETFVQTLQPQDNAFIYLIEGGLNVGQEVSKLESRQLGVLSQGEQLSVQADSDSRFLLVAGQPLNEPVARGGPFVMNTKAEILQAFQDFQNNRF